MRTMPLTTLSSATTLLSAQIRRTQDEATKLQSEVSSGRRYDVGRELGSQVGALTVFKQEAETLRASTEINQNLAGRLDASQAALSNISENANAFLAALMSARGDPRNADIVSKQAEQSFKSFQAAANTSHSGVYVFSGENTGTAPFVDYFSVPTPNSRASVQAAFVTEFGFPSSDPAAENIPVSSMQAYLGTTFSGLFSEPDWSTNWSTATEKPVESNIGSTRRIVSSVTTHEDAFRKISSAYAMIVDGGTTHLNEASYQAVIDGAAKLIAEGVAEIGELQGMMGNAESELSAASERLTMRRNLVERIVSEQEAVDLSEVSIRLNTLLNQLEATYVVTGRLQNLSLLKVI